MPRKRQPGDIRTTIMLPGDLHRTVKAACALEGITVNKKLHDLLTREYPDALEPPKRRRRQPSKIVAQLEGAER
jgi:hypothetical protein